MSLDGWVDAVDVVIIGFGVAGAAAAVAAAGTGARVLVVDRRGAPCGRNWRRSPEARTQAALRAAARAAGVEVRAHRRAHELVMDGDRVRGVGYAAPSEHKAGAVAFRCLDRLDKSGSSSARAFARAADRVWQSDFRIGEIGCASVVLALDPCHWDFVGPAMWAAARSARGPVGMPPVSRRLRVVGAEETGAEPKAEPTPELSARMWCAQRDATATVRCDQRELRVDAATGAVLVGGEPGVLGLYSAVPADGGETSGSVSASAHGRAVAAGMRAGGEAAREALSYGRFAGYGSGLGLTGL